VSGTYFGTYFNAAGLGHSSVIRPAGLTLALLVRFVVNRIGSC